MMSFKTQAFDHNLAQLAERSMGWGVGRWQKRGSDIYCTTGAFRFHHSSKHELHQDLIFGLWGFCWTALEGFRVLQISLMCLKISEVLRNIGDVVGIHAGDRKMISSRVGL